MYFNNIIFFGMLKLKTQSNNSNRLNNRIHGFLDKSGKYKHKLISSVILFNILSQFIQEQTNAKANMHITQQQSFQKQNHFKSIQQQRNQQKCSLEQLSTIKHNKNSQFKSVSLDDTTYQSLMSEFMGAYLQQKIIQGNQKAGIGKSVDIFSDTKYKNGFQEDLQNNKQITFSGSKNLQLLLESEEKQDNMIDNESRILKEEYFLYDRLKNSTRNSKNNSGKQLRHNQYEEEKFQLYPSKKIMRKGQGQKQANVRIQKVNLMEEFKCRNKKIQHCRDDHKQLLIQKKTNSSMKRNQKINIAKQINQRSNGRVSNVSRTTEKQRQNCLKKSNKNGLQRQQKQHKPIIVEIQLSEFDIDEEQKKMVNSGKKQVKVEQVIRNNRVSGSKRSTRLNKLNENKYPTKTFQKAKRYTYDCDYEIKQMNSLGEVQSANNTSGLLNKRGLIDSIMKAKESGVLEQERNSNKNNNSDREMIKQIKKDLSILIDKISSSGSRFPQQEKEMLISRRKSLWS